MLLVHSIFAEFLLHLIDDLNLCFAALQRIRLAGLIRVAQKRTITLTTSGENSST